MLTVSLLHVTQYLLPLEANVFYVLYVNFNFGNKIIFLYKT